MDKEVCLAIAASLPFALLLSVGVLHGCARTTAMIDRNESGSGQPIPLKIGQQLRIRLPENVTTGYSWQRSPGCDALLRLDSDETSSPVSRGLGAGGERTWLFTAHAKGRCNLGFTSLRPWEKEQPAAGKTLIFPVSID